MDTIEAPRAVIGGNQPPAESLVEMLRDRLALEFEGLVTRREELLAGVARAPVAVEDDDVCGRMADFVKQITAAIKNADGTRIKEKEPYLEAGRVVDGFFKGVIDPLTKAKATVQKRMDDYLNRKAAEERRRREEEARRAADEARAREAEMMAAAEQSRLAAADADKAIDETIMAQAKAEDAAKDAAAKPAELARTRGEYGAVATLRQTWEFEVLDIHAVDLAAIRPYLPIAAVEQAIRGFVKAGHRELAGVRIYQRSTAAVR